MAKHFAQKPAVEMPDILGPHSLDLMSIYQLPKGGVDAMPDCGQTATCLEFCNIINRYWWQKTKAAGVPLRVPRPSQLVLTLAPDCGLDC
jgi:hypothetical protein